MKGDEKCHHRWEKSWCIQHAQCLAKISTLNMESSAFRHMQIKLISKRVKKSVDSFHSCSYSENKPTFFAANSMKCATSGRQIEKIGGKCRISDQLQEINMYGKNIHMCINNSTKKKKKKKNLTCLTSMVSVSGCSA